MTLRRLLRRQATGIQVGDWRQSDCQVQVKFVAAGFCQSRSWSARPADSELRAIGSRLILPCPPGLPYSSTSMPPAATRCCPIRRPSRRRGRQRFSNAPGSATQAAPPCRPGLRLPRLPARHSARLFAWPGATFRSGHMPGQASWGHKCKCKGVTRHVASGHHMIGRIFLMSHRFALRRHKFGSCLRNQSVSAYKGPSPVLVVLIVQKILLGQYKTNYQSSNYQTFQAASKQL